MKKSLITIFLLGSFSFMHAIDINTLKWTEDFETLVSLSSGTENTLEGVDQNKNGIRDDVEYYINTKYQDQPFQKEMFSEAAKKIQKIITLSKTEPIATHEKLDRELLNIYTCRDYILYKMESEDIGKELEDKLAFKGKMLNTKKRLHAHIEHKQILPFQFDDLTQDQLARDKIACMNLYNKVAHPDKGLISSK